MLQLARGGKVSIKPGMKVKRIANNYGNKFNEMFPGRVFTVKTFITPTTIAVIECGGEWKISNFTIVDKTHSTTHLPEYL